MANTNLKTESRKFVRFGNRILSLVLKKRTAENLLGDLQETFNDKSKSDPNAANWWYAKQFSLTFIAGICDRLKSDRSVNLMMLGVTVAIVPIIFCMVAWLSNMDETTPVVWQLLLEGKMHQIVFFREFWSVQPEALPSVEVSMFLGYKSIFWAVLCLVLINRIASRPASSVRLIAFIGMTAMLLPYLLGLAFIHIYQPIPTQVGPILAFMLLNVFYLLLPVSFLVNKKYRQHAHI
jgi:hypothetical protein